MVSSAHITNGGWGSFTLYVSKETEAVELFDDESNFFWYGLSCLVWVLCCVASYEWVEALIYPEDNDTLADDKWQLYEK